MGLAEETIVYIAIITPLAIALGLDAIVGYAVVSLGATIGFMSAVLNPFNVGVAQSIAELPTFSGMGLRMILFVTLYIAGVLYVYRYAKKVKANPELRYLGNYREGTQVEFSSNIKLTTRHKWVLITFLFNFVFLIFGVIKFGWYISEIAALFLLFGILIGIVGKLKPNKIADSFIDGTKDVLSGALIIGFATAFLLCFRMEN